MNIRQKGWQEVKIGTVLDLAVTAPPAADTGELIELLPIRSARLSPRFDDRWVAAKNLPPV
jgi:hypothetical protein